MSLLAIVGYALAALAALVGVAILIATGWVVMRTGVVKGLKDAADGWEKRADLLTRDLADCHRDAAAAAALATENAAVIAEQHRAEIGEVRDALSSARERIAVLEAATDLSAVQASLDEQNRETAVVRAELEAQKVVLHEALEEHNAEAHDRHEKIVGAQSRMIDALDRIATRLETAA